LIAHSGESLKAVNQGAREFPLGFIPRQFGGDFYIQARNMARGLFLKGAYLKEPPFFVWGLLGCATEGL